MSETRIEYRVLDDVVEAERNPKDHDLGAVITSIRRFGFVNPAVEGFRDRPARRRARPARGPPGNARGRRGPLPRVSGSMTRVGGTCRSWSGPGS
jgi:hypothetical protein